MTTASPAETSGRGETGAASPAPATRYLVTAQRRGRFHSHLLGETPDASEARRLRGDWQLTLDATAADHDWTVSVHQITRVI